MQRLCHNYQFLVNRMITAWISSHKRIYGNNLFYPFSVPFRKTPLTKRDDIRSSDEISTAISLKNENFTYSSYESERKFFKLASFQILLDRIYANFFFPRSSSF